MKTTVKSIVVLSLGFFLIYISSCQKEGTSMQNHGTSRISIRMTDIPADYTAVNIDIKAVQILYKDSSMINCRDSVYNHPGMDSAKFFCDCDDSTGVKWATLTTNAGIYNLLKFKDGIDTIIATGQIPAGKILQIRLVLGLDNSIVAGTDTFHLVVPGGMESGLKIILNRMISAENSLDIVFDFNTSTSVIIIGHNRYLLKPILRLKSALQRNSGLYY